tara:strand:- start:42 stop:509 length:468 start_codon:yes stop_codon:yes gene_type:complete
MSTRKYKRTIQKKLKQHNIEVVGLEENKHLKFFCIHKGKKKTLVVGKTPSNGCWERGIEWNIRKVFNNMITLKDEYIDGMNVVASGAILNIPYMIIDDDGELAVVTSAKDRKRFTEEVHKALLRQFQHEIRRAMLTDTGFYPTQKYLNKCYRENA